MTRTPAGPCPGPSSPHSPFVMGFGNPAEAHRSPPQPPMQGHRPPAPPSGPYRCHGHVAVAVPGRGNRMPPPPTDSRGTSVYPFGGPTDGQTPSVGCANGTITVGRLVNSMLFVDIANGISNWRDKGDVRAVISPIGNNHQAAFQPFYLADPNYSYRYDNTDGSLGGSNWAVAMLPPTPADDSAFKVAVGYSHMTAQYRGVPLQGLPMFRLPSSLIPSSSNEAYVPQPAFVADQESTQLEGSPAHKYAKPGRQAAPPPGQEALCLPAHKIAPWPRASVRQGNEVSIKDLVFAVSGHKPSPLGNSLLLCDATDQQNTVLTIWPTEPPFGTSVEYEIERKTPILDPYTNLVAIPVKNLQTNVTSWFVLDFQDPLSPKTVHEEKGLCANGGFSQGILYGQCGAGIIAKEVVKALGRPGGSPCSLDFSEDYEYEDEGYGIGIAMDWDVDLRDGLDFDRPQEDRKYTFWVNDDYDGKSAEGEDDFEGTGMVKNCDDDVINTVRDLEDFSRLHVRIDPRLREKAGVTYSLRFDPLGAEDGEGGSDAATPSINIFAAVDPSPGYLTDTAKAGAQVELGNRKDRKMPITVGHNDVQIPAEAIKKDEERERGDGEDEDVIPFIFEGKSPGKGRLVLTAKMIDKPLAEASLELELADIAEFYEKYVVEGIGGTDFVAGNDRPVGPAQRAYQPETSDYVLYVHGWNMADWEKDRWAETVFKRLYWQGHRGHVGCFQWPTREVDLTKALGDEPVFGYNESEFRAYQSGQVLARRLERLIGEGKKVHILAHSMGNVVVGQALKDMRTANGKIQNYIATQAAVSAHMYDNTVPEMGLINKGPNTTSDLFGHFYDGTPVYEPYLRSAGGKVEGGMYNYYNERDFALTYWRINNWAKPWLPVVEVGTLWGSPIKTEGYSCTRLHSGVELFDPGNETFHRQYRVILPVIVPPLIFSFKVPLRLEKDTFEILAHCVKSRSDALGAVPGNINGWVGEGVDLRDSKYNFNDTRYSHSKQFRSNVAEVWNYWTQVMTHFKLPGGDSEDGADHKE